MKVKTLARVQGLYWVVAGAGFVLWAIAFFLNFHRLISPGVITWACLPAFIIAIIGMFGAGLGRPWVLIPAVAATWRLVSFTYFGQSTTIFEPLAWLVVATVLVALSHVSQEKEMVEGLHAET